MAIVARLRVCLTSLVFALLIPGCSAYVAFVSGEPEHTQMGVLEAVLQVDGQDMTVRASAECRSFFHPNAGIRVTRKTGEMFELLSQGSSRRFVSLPYECRLSDARIELPEHLYISVFEVEQQPEPRVEARWAIRANHPEAPRASVKLLTYRVDTDDSRTNAVPTERLVTGAGSVLPGRTVLTAVSVFPLSIDDGVIDAKTISLFSDASAPTPLDRGVARTVIVAHEKKNYVPLGRPSSYNHAAALLNQIPLLYRREHNDFVRGIEPSGKRVFVPVPVRECNGVRDCKPQEIYWQADQIKTDALMVYDPATRVIYWRRVDHIGLRPD